MADKLGNYSSRVQKSSHPMIVVTSSKGKVTTFNSVEEYLANRTLPKTKVVEE